jgi:hypothetical protein
MNERERERPERPRFAGEPSGTGEADGLEAARTRADRLLQAADDAIARALSGNSEHFLNATRQSGGQ